ncbi:hypothetical protein CEXT_671971 [Caerostris extrusa]|uniref:Uncharacterized protein n=1 Tax=Caerostris extrusa TaxID=172846 RepID=A0AAV4WE51_CAEEX|nr:hypothetical protein CEXT_671971 [Caerostris extrusa]
MCALKEAKGRGISLASVFSGGVQASRRPPVDYGGCRGEGQRGMEAKGRRISLASVFSGESKRRDDPLDYGGCGGGSRGWSVIC